MSKLLYTRFTKLIINYLLSLNKSIPRKSDSNSDAMISDAIKKKEGYKYYMAKKVESKKGKIIDEREEQHVSPIKSGRGKGFMCYGDHVANVPNKLKKDVVPRKTRSLTIAEEALVGELANSISIQEPHAQQRRRSQLRINSQTDEAVADMYNEWEPKLKGPTVEDPAVQSLLDLWKGSKASRLENTNSDATLYSSSSDKLEESANETDDDDESDMDLSNDNLHGDDDDARFKTWVNPSASYLANPNTSMRSRDASQEEFDILPVVSEQDELPSSVGHDFRARLDDGRMYSGHLEANKGDAMMRGHFVVVLEMSPWLQIEFFMMCDIRSGYQQKDRKPSQNDKTEHGMEKTVQNQGQSPKVRVNTEESAVKPEPELKNTIECNLNPSDGPGKPNSIFMKTVKTKWALNQLQQPICVQLTKTVKTLKARS
ncbi:hypothetical protein Tco_0167530 [Tanacetum coccineum]